MKKRVAFPLLVLTEELLREHLGEIVDFSYRTARRTLNDMTGGNG
jgi:hypothetical protein